jgi:hypothetical protein
MYIFVSSQHVYKVDIKNCYALERNWQEGSVTWNSPWQSPGGDFSEPPVFVNTNTVKNVWEEFDVTDAVKAMINNSKPNYGFLISFLSTSDKSRAAYYRSSEYTGDTSLRPKLVIVSGTTGTTGRDYKEDTRVQFKIMKDRVWIYMPECRGAIASMYTLAGKKLASFNIDGRDRWYHSAASFSPGIHIIKLENNGRTIIRKVHW